MAVESLISVEEYLKTVYRPDRDYVDGSVEERNLGERDHSRLTAQIVVWFYSLETEKNIRVYPEQRVQVSPTKFRVPDICIDPTANRRNRYCAAALCHASRFFAGRPTEVERSLPDR